MTCDIPWYRAFPRNTCIINISMYFGATEKWHVQMVMVIACCTIGGSVGHVESLSSDNNLSSWSVYKENNGFITLKIRYSEVANLPNRVVEGHYRRKSQRQMDRDSERHRQWQAGHRADQCPSQTVHDQQQGPPQNTEDSLE